MQTKIEDVNLLNDYLFKALFRSVEARELVASFLSHVTGVDEKILRNAEYQGGEIPKKNAKEKGKIADVIIKLQNNHRIVLEMNQYASKEIFEKNTNYAFAMVSEIMQVGSNEYPYVCLINFDNFNKFETDRYKSIHLILENIMKDNYNEDKEIKKMVKFLMSKRIKDMKNEYKGDEKYMAAVRKIEELSTDPNFVGYYDYEEAKKQDMHGMYLTGVDDGIEKGLAQGMKQKQNKIIKNLLAKGYDIKEIAEIAEVSVEEIESLK